MHPNCEEATSAPVVGVGMLTIMPTFTFNYIHKEPFTATALLLKHTHRASHEARQPLLALTSARSCICSRRNRGGGGHGTAATGHVGVG